MNPKTFHVMIRKPYGFLVAHGINMYVHKETFREVIEWVENTFVGVNTKPTLLRMAEVGTAAIKVGNNDPVVIHDVDCFGKAERIAGKLVMTKVPEGHWRRSEKDVSEDLFKTANFLRDTSNSLTESFHGLKHQYEIGNTQDWAYDRLIEMKNSIERADVWQKNVWSQYCALRQMNGLELPERRKEKLVAMSA